MINREIASGGFDGCITTLNGDYLSASSLAHKYKGAHMVDILNSTPIDYVVLGNHEFDFSAEVLRERIAESRFEIFASNILDTETGEVMDGCLRKKVLQVGSVRIGMFGVCTRATLTLSKPGPSVSFESEVETACSLVRELKETDGCDVIIALTHLSISQDRELARRVPDIDVMIGGHDHQFHTQQQGKCFIHKSGVDAHYLARIDLTIEKRCDVIDMEGKKPQELTNVNVFPEWRMILNRDIEPDPLVKEKVDRYLAELPSDSGEPVALCLTPLDTTSSSLRSKECAFANLCTDIIQEKYAVDIAFINGGTIRGDRFYEAGTMLFKSDMYAEFPFPTTMLRARIDGKHLLQVIEHGLSGAESMLGRFLHYSRGMRIEYDLAKSPYQRVLHASLHGTEIESEKEYSIASTDYLMAGGDGFSALKEGATVDSDFTFLTMDDMIVAWLMAQGTVSSKKEGRVYASHKKR